MMCGLLNIVEAAEYLKIDKQTLYNKVSEKKIPYIKIFKGRRLGFLKEDLDNLIQQWRIEAVNEWKVS